MKTYLHVPFKEKDHAKALGARWDAHNRLWYVPAGRPLAPFMRWKFRRTHARANFAGVGTVGVGR